MDTLVIPSLLQGKLQERMTTEFGSPSIIEVGGNSVTIAVEQSQNITRFLKSTKKSKTGASASKPSVLLLLSQEMLETSLDDSTCKNITCLSEAQSPRQDLSALNDESVVLATTPQRAIDHIRRDNIFLSHTKAVVLAYSFEQDGEETPEQLTFREQAFLDDCRFIFTKLDPNTHIEIFLDSLSHLARSPQELLGQPTVIAMADWERPQLPVECYATPPTATDTILDILYAMQEHRYIIVHKNDSASSRLERRLRSTIPRMEITKIGFDRLQAKRRSGNPKEIPSTVVAIGLDSGETITLIRHIHEWESSPQRIVCITEPQKAEEIITSKETLLMKNEKRSIPETDEVLAGKIQMLVAKLAIDSNPEELENLRKLFKKNVPFHRRGYFTAYLLRELLGGDKRPSGTRSTSTAKTPTPTRDNEVKQEKPQRAKRQAAKPNTQDIPEGARTLYLNIGKMRRLYAKELSQILQDNLEITREDIYSLRIHDKYSFITLSQENAEKAIEKMNGMDIRGRTASITYSNKE